MQRTNNRKPAAKRIGSLEIGDRRPIETQGYVPPDSRQGAWPLVTRSPRSTNPGVHDREQLTGGHRNARTPLLPVTKPGKGDMKTSPHLDGEACFFLARWNDGLGYENTSSLLGGQAGGRAAIHPTVYPSVFFLV